VTNDVRQTKYSSKTKTVTFKMAEMKINLGQKLRVKVNGSRIQLPYAIDELVKINKTYDDEVIVETHLGIKLIWDGYNFLQVEAPVRYKNKLCGLCGNYNNIGRDDLISRNGVNISENDVRKFADSWRVGGLKACARKPYEHVQKPQRCPTAKKKMAKCQELKRQEIFDNCISRVNPDKYFDFCKMDMCDCPSYSCYCESFAAYAHECERNGVKLPLWREMSKCKLFNRNVHQSDMQLGNRKKLRKTKIRHQHPYELLHRQQNYPKVITSGQRTPPPLL
jgi:BMP-binding endothelial regulator protein